MSRYLDFSLGLADRADEISLEGFRSSLTISTKTDGSIVTIYDKQVEEVLTGLITEQFPDEVILGEEEGVSGGGDVRWIIDPIDGTINFASGVPVWATLIAHLTDGVVDAAVVSAPALHSRWWAAAGEGSFHNSDPIRVSSTATIEESAISHGTWGIFGDRRDALRRVLDRCRHSRGFGDFWGHMLVASGSVDAMIDPVVSVWDVAAPSLIVEESGGVFTRMDGSSGLGGDALSANPRLHPQLCVEFGGTVT